MNHILESWTDTPRPPCSDHHCHSSAQCFTGQQGIPLRPKYVKMGKVPLICLIPKYNAGNILDAPNTMIAQDTLPTSPPLPHPSFIFASDIVLPPNSHIAYLAYMYLPFRSRASQTPTSQDEVGELEIREQKNKRRGSFALCPSL